MLRVQAQRIIDQVFGPMIPFEIYCLMQKKMYRTIIRGFTIESNRY